MAELTRDIADQIVSSQDVQDMSGALNNTVSVTSRQEPAAPGFAMTRHTIDDDEQHQTTLMGEILKSIVGQAAELDITLKASDFTFTDLASTEGMAGAVSLGHTHQKPRTGDMEAAHEAQNVQEELGKPSRWRQMLDDTDAKKKRLVGALQRKLSDNYKVEAPEGYDNKMVVDISPKGIIDGLLVDAGVMPERDIGFVQSVNASFEETLGRKPRQGEITINGNPVKISEMERTSRTESKPTGPTGHETGSEGPDAAGQAMGAVGRLLGRGKRGERDGR